MGQNQKPSVIRLVLNSLIVLFASGDWRWLEGWIFALWFVAMILSATIYLAIRDPALLAER
jgi:hypothetical protein